MKARDIWNFIYEIQKTPKTNDKKDILVKYKNEPNLHLYLQYVYDEVDFVWGKSKLPVIASTPIEPNLQDEDLSEFYNGINKHLFLNKQKSFDACSESMTVLVKKYK